MQMKAKNIRLFMAAAAVFLLYACVEEKFQPAANDLGDCMGVYFVEEQENAKTHTLEKDVDTTALEFIVRRVNVEEAAEIPYEYSVYKIVQTANSDTTYVENPVEETNKFKFGKIRFAKGQRECKLTVQFDDIPTGETFRCSMNINDPKYAHIYGYACTSLTFSVQMYEWKKVEGKAIFREDFIADVLGLDTGYPETSVNIYERRDKKGFFRLDEVYSASYLARVMEGDEAYEDDKKSLESKYAPYVTAKSQLFVDASNPDKVYIPEQNIGLASSFLGGVITMASDVEEVFPGASNLLYGTLSDDGVITFPKNGIIFGMSGMYYFSNTSGKTRIVLPGGKSEDYGIELSSTEAAADGSRPVTFKIAKDVETVKYHVFQGVVNELTILDSLEYVKTNGTSINVDGQKSIEKNIVPMKEDAPTSIYTLVACTFGKGDTEYREYSSIEFGYVKPGEKMDIEIYMGLSTDDQYASDKPEDNYDSSNSFRYWIRGKDITNVQIAYYPTSYYMTYKEKIEESMIKSTSVNSQTIKALNNGGLAGILGNTLQPCTSYTLLVYAGNGYANKFFTDTISTKGIEDLTQKSFYLYDIEQFNQPGIEAFAGDWAAVSYDIFDADVTKKTIRGNWRAKEVKLTVEDNIVKASGLFPSLKTNPSVKFAIKDNLIYTQENKGAKVMVKDSTHIVPNMRFEHQYIPKTGALSSSGYFYEKFNDDTADDRTDMMCAGFVHKDIIAFVDNRTDFNFYAFAMGGFQKDGMGKENLVDIIGDAHGELILVRKDSELLDGLKSQESTTARPTESLSTIKGANKITAPKFGKVEGEQKYVDDSINSKVEFRSDLQVKTILK